LQKYRFARVFAGSSADEGGAERGKPQIRRGILLKNGPKFKGICVFPLDFDFPAEYDHSDPRKMEGERIMGLFGKSFDEKVHEGVAAVEAKNLGVKNLRATVDGKVVTLEGEAPNLDVKGLVVRHFNALVDTENTINKIKIPAPATAGKSPAPAPAAPAEAAQIHVVVAGDTLSALAKKYYGKPGMYMKIFEANRDLLSDPNLIKVGQKLRIPQ